MAIDRIETVLTEGWSPDSSFSAGKTRRARGKTGEARRFSFVRGLDGLIAIGGASGTAQELALAHELGVRVLPVPCVPGEAAEFWKAYREDLIPALRLNFARAKAWENLNVRDEETVQSVANEMVDALVGSLSRRCFVIMPFHEDFGALFDFVIQPAIQACGDQSIRLDRASIPGDIGEQIRDGIKTCDYVIVVLDGLRPNVLYEMGLAHGYGKPTVLVNRAGGLGNEGLVPFDIAMQQRVEYKTLDNSLVGRIRDAIVELSSTTGQQPGNSRRGGESTEFITGTV
ncbi:hypothetical protein HB774_34410 (plasmid) [Rhizobium leguminosarum bv. viciae]|nr:hypothetical protein HB774_34410 [Rhizobium leguminosarum bv. viciae]